MAAVSAWLIACLVLALVLAGCTGVILRARGLGTMLVATQLAGAIAVLILLSLSVALQRPAFLDLALALALLSVPAGLMFAYFIQHLDS